MISIRKTPDGVVFKVLVQPRSSKNMIAGLHDGALKIKLTAPPVDNAANKMGLKFLAKSLGVARSNLEIIAGQTSRHKQILLRSDHTPSTEDEYQTLKGMIESLVTT